MTFAASLETRSQASTETGRLETMRGAGGTIGTRYHPGTVGDSSFSSLESPQFGYRPRSLLSQQFDFHQSFSLPWPATHWSSEFPLFLIPEFH